MSDTSEPTRLTTIPGACPTPVELGVSGWNILHSSAAVYPYKPSAVQRAAMQNFIELWAHVYACSWCAYHMRAYVREHPPDVQDKLTVSRYLCELHNEVNERIGKDLFDCSPDVVLRRWHPGYPDKMADTPTIEEQLAAAAQKKKEAQEAKHRQQAAEERRLSEFGLYTRQASRKEAKAWRDTAAESSEKKPPSEVASRGWWLFEKAFTDRSSAAGLAEPSTTVSPAASTVPPPARDRSGPSPLQYGWTTSPTTQADRRVAPPSRAKVADDETDVEEVLARLKRCQVYCPEEEPLK